MKKRYGNDKPAIEGMPVGTFDQLLKGLLFIPPLKKGN